MGSTSMETESKVINRSGRRGGGEDRSEGRGIVCKI